MNWNSYWLGVSTPFVFLAVVFVLGIIWLWLRKVLKWSVPYACACEKHLENDAWWPDTLFHGWPWQRWWQWWMHRMSKVHRINVYGLHHSTKYVLVTNTFSWKKSFVRAFSRKQQS